MNLPTDSKGGSFRHSHRTPVTLPCCFRSFPKWGTTCPHSPQCFGAFTFVTWPSEVVEVAKGTCAQLLESELTTKFQRLPLFHFSRPCCLQAPGEGWRAGSSVLFLSFGCSGSSLLCVGFLYLQEAWAALQMRCSASACCVFPCCRARAQYRLSGCDAQAQFPHSMGNLPGPGVELMSPALAGGFLTLGPPAKSVLFCFKQTLNLRDAARPTKKTVLFVPQQSCWVVCPPPAPHA